MFRCVYCDFILNRAWRPFDVCGTHAHLPVSDSVENYSLTFNVTASPKSPWWTPEQIRSRGCVRQNLLVRAPSPGADLGAWVRCYILTYWGPYSVVSDLNLHVKFQWRIWGGARDARPIPPCPKFLLFFSCSFFRGKWSNSMLAPPLGLAPLLWEILDPPLWTLWSNLDQTVAMGNQDGSLNTMHSKAN